MQKIDTIEWDIGTLIYFSLKGFGRKVSKSKLLPMKAPDSNNKSSNKSIKHMHTR